MNTITTLTCGHFHKSAAGAILECWPVFKNDRRVTTFPYEAVPVHNCEKLAVAQEKKSINRLYIVKDESIIVKNQA